MVAVGEKVFGKYEVLRRLAVGGMGEIFLSRQTGVIDRLVILKNLLPQLASEAQSVAAFLDEARILGCVNHPNVVALYDVGEWGGTHFHAMEYVNGVDISHLLKHCEEKSLRVPPAVSAQIVREAALGLDAAHVAGDATGAPLRIVHRDISPHNLMVRADGLCKVVDFGVAVAENRSQKTDGVGLLKGKLGYMAPEQIKGGPAEPKCDQFSLGVVLWELLAQRRLFTGENAPAIFTRIVKEKIAPPSQFRSDVPPELDAIALRMTAQEPVDRFARLADAALAIRKALDALKTPDNATAQFVRSTVGPELAARVKDLAAPAPARTATQGTPSSTAPGAMVFCGNCGTPAPAGDRFCRLCGKVVGGAAGTPHGGTPLATPAATLAPPRTPAAGTAARSVDDRRSASHPGVAVPRLDVLGAPPRTTTGGFRLDAPLGLGSKTPSVATRAVSPQGGADGTVELAVVVGLVEQLRGGVTVAADADALAAASLALAAHAQAADATLNIAEARFAMTFAGERAAVRAVAVARANVRLSSRIGHDALLRLAVVSDGAAPVDFAARLRAVGERLVAHAAPGASLITEDARVRAGAGAGIITGRSGSFAQPDGTQVIAHDLTLPRRLVGRAPVLTVLDDLLDDVARSGRSQQVALVGDGGVGKSALVQAAAAFARDRQFVVGLARGARATPAPTLDVVRQLVKSACVDLLARERAPGGWTRALELLGLPAATAARLRALVEDDGDGGLPHVSAARRANVARSAVLALFERLCERTPVLLVVDDAERADADGLALLAELATRLGDRRLAVVAAGRPIADERILPQARRLVVDPLPAGDAISVAALAVGAPLGVPLAQLLVAHGRGEPLTIVALVRWLGASGVLAVGAGGVGLQGDPSRLAIPAGASAALAALHAALPADAQTVLRAAAGFGHVVEPVLVGHVAEGVADLATALRVLGDAGVLEPWADDRWLFRSAVECEAALAADEATAAQRRVGRRAEAFAQSLAARFRLDVAERLADHLAALDALPHVVEASSLLATRAEAVGLLELAATHWRRALQAELRRVAASPSADGAARALHCAARATSCLADTAPATAIDVVVPALPLVRAAPRVAAEALRHRARALSLSKRFVDAEGGLVQALEVLSAADDDAIACDLLVDLAGVLEQRGDDAGAVQRLEDALQRFAAARAARPDLPPDRGFEALLLHSRLIARRGRAAEAKATLRRALESARAAGRAALAVDILQALVGIAQAEGDGPAASQLLGDAATVAVDACDSQLEARVLAQLARLQTSAGKRDDARATLVRALAAARAGLWDDGVTTLQKQLASSGS